MIAVGGAAQLPPVNLDSADLPPSEIRQDLAKVNLDVVEVHP